MSKAKRSIPIFPLGPEAVWEDVLNAIEASVQYQSEHGGNFGPLFAFAPMTEPEDPDRWEPLATEPLNLLLVSTSRGADATMLKVFARAEPQIGALERYSPGSPLAFQWQDAVAVLYARMEELGVGAYRFSTGDGEGVFLRARASRRSCTQRSAGGGAEGCIAAGLTQSKPTAGNRLRHNGVRYAEICH